MDRLGQEFSVFHLAACIANLPIGSALMARVHPEYSVALRDFPIQALIKAFTKETDNQIGDGAEGMPLDEFKEWLNQPWKDIDNG